jgi:mannose/fructose/N-acetylgalactosamine-specific phosphotransferase system component IIB
MAEYQGVDVEHPTIKAAIENMTKQGEPKEKIMRVVGMPAEVIDRVQRRLKEQK